VSKHTTDSDDDDGIVIEPPTIATGKRGRGRPSTRSGNVTDGASGGCGSDAGTNSTDRTIAISKCQVGGKGKKHGNAKTDDDGGEESDGEPAAKQGKKSKTVPIRQSGSSAASSNTCATSDNPSSDEDA
jgi:hypothetical protein